MGAFVRIRAGADAYRLVKVVDVHDGLEEYAIGSAVTNKTLEVNNFGRTEILPISTVSNQEFSPEECARLAEATLQWGVYPKMTKGDPDVDDHHNKPVWPT
jgi:hypothetical protein